MPHLNPVLRGRVRGLCYLTATVQEMEGLRSPAWPWLARENGSEPPNMICGRWLRELSRIYVVLPGAPNGRRSQDYLKPAPGATSQETVAVDLPETVALSELL